MGNNHPLCQLSYTPEKLRITDSNCNFLGQNQAGCHYPNPHWWPGEPAGTTDRGKEL